MEDVKSNSGIGFFGILTIVFIVLKLTNVITWSWWWVLSPLWLPIVAGIVICGAVFLFIWCIAGLKS